MAARKSEGFSRRYRLGSNKNYRFVYRRGKSTPSRNVVLVYLKGRDLKIGFSVSAKVGKAVTRNRIRRWMREDVRKMRTEFKCGKYIFVARPSIAHVPHEALSRELRTLLNRAKLLKSSVPASSDGGSAEAPGPGLHNADACSPQAGSDGQRPIEDI